MKTIIWLAALALVLAPRDSAAEADTQPAIQAAMGGQIVDPIGDDWYPLNLNWRETGPAEWDFSPYFHEPAGRYGHVRAEKEFFVVGDPPRRIRFWGCNLSAHGAAPSREQAPIVARYLRKYGFNAVRFSHLDALWNNDALVVWSNTDTLVFNEGALDRWFYFIAELKKQGIYVTLDGMHHFFFHLKEHHPMAPANAGGQDFRRKGLPFLYFVDALQEHHKMYLRRILAGVNPHTGTTLAEDPALLGICIINEPGMSRWDTFRLANVPEAYRGAFEDLWREWRAETNPEVLRPARDYDSVPVAARRRFWQWTERRFNRVFLRFYRDELGVRAPITTGNGYVNSVEWPTAAMGDYAEGHAYYAHRRAVEVEEDGRNNRYWGFVHNPSWLNYLAHQRIGYQPFTVGEWNGGGFAPKRYQAPLDIVVLAQRQQWDGLFMFNLVQSPWDAVEARKCGQFASIGDPSRMSNMLAAALIFHGQRIPGAERDARVTSSPDLLAENLTMAKGVFEGMAKYGYRLFNCPEYHGIPSGPPDLPQVDFFGSLPTDMEEFRARCPVYYPAGVLAVHADKAAILSGEVGGRTLRAGPMTLEAPAGEEYSLTLIALDDEKIEQAKRILVALGPISLPRETEFLGAVEMEAPYLPTGEKETLHYYAGGIGVVPETDPVVKPSSGRVSLVHSRPMNGWLLDWTGKRAMPLETEYQDGQVHFTIQPQDKVLWYMLETE